MKPNCASNLQPSPGMRPRGFSLIELLAVLAIIAILVTLLAPAVNSFRSVAGRKGAVNILMNTFEQARAAALESGATVYVVMWKRKFPDQDSIIVVRDPVQWNTNETGLVALTRWQNLPKGVLLYDPPGVGKNLFKAGVPTGFKITDLPRGQQLKDTDLAFLQFAPTGAIQHPADKDFLRLMVGEGFRGNDGNETLVNANKQLGLFDVITFRRFTGRASLDVSELSKL